MRFMGATSSAMAAPKDEEAEGDGDEKLD